MTYQNKVDALIKMIDDCQKVWTIRPELELPLAGFLNLFLKGQAPLEIDEDGKTLSLFGFNYDPKKEVMYLIYR